MFNKYLVYLQNNPKHYWFKRKIWGWGWVPATRQGWVVTLLYAALIFILVFVREENIPGSIDSGSNFLVLGFPVMVATCLFIFIVYKKGEKPRWQCGVRK